MLTTKEMAELAEVTRRMVLYWCKNGDLPATKMGRDWVIDSNDAQAFVAARAEKNK